MEHVGIKHPQRWWISIGIAGLLWITGCEEEVHREILPTSQRETVRVAVPIGWGAEEDFVFAPSTPEVSATGAPASEKADTREAFQYTLLSPAPTRAFSDILFPDQLYNLEIQQYDLAGNRIGGMSAAVTQAIGSVLTVPLATSDDCQLVAVAWGEGNTTRLGTSSLDEARKNAVIAPSLIDPLDPSRQTDMNKMPYVLHLPHVKVTAGNTTGTGILCSLDADDKDIRLRLKRIAARLQMTWSYAFPGYALQQIHLQSVPVNYTVLPQPDAKDQTYPSLLEQFTTLQLTATDLASGRYACWMPANVRGVNTAVTSAFYRTKQTAPTGSTYASFIAVNTADPKKKLDYRLYLGGAESSDFNLYNHTNYIYTVHFRHTQLPVSDGRVTVIDPISASEGNHNFVPTANCFMIAPGGAFCFDPFTFRQEGSDIVNTHLQSWAGAEGGIAYVRLLWQTKESGDVGDPVLGVVNSDTDHTNIVTVEKNDGTPVSATNALTDAGQGRIYCRVAPNTTGGSGVIAAYTKDDKILWSWHVWVTDYNPDPFGGVSVYEPVTKRKQVYRSSSYTNLYPMMDRNLGAFVGLDRVPEDRLEMTKANGFHYQRGRKDPFPGAFTTSEESNFNAVIVSGYPPKNFLNRYEGDGLSWIIAAGHTLYSTLREAYATPLSIGSASSNSQWCKEQTNGWNTTLKGLHDPCPAGWRIPQTHSVYQPLVENNSNAAGYNEVKRNGGVLLRYEKESERVTYVRYAGYPTTSTSVINVGINGYLNVGLPDQIFELGLSGNNPAIKLSTKWNTDVHTVRCMQEKNE